MKLEVGKYYRTRDGRRAEYAGMSHVSGHSFVLFDGDTMSSLIADRDIIAEWADDPKCTCNAEHDGPCRSMCIGPVRTVTRISLEIVPGVYGKVRVYDDGAVFMYATTDLADLTAAIETLTAIKEAME